MKTQQDEILETVFNVINDVKMTNFSVESIEPDCYLGGELGIDSREMLEIWYDLEKQLGVHIPDSRKRDIYTVAEVVKVLCEELVARDKSLKLAKVAV